MAAPITAYLDNKNDLQNGANNYDTYIARFLQNTTPTSGDDWGDGYFNSTDDDATKKSKICDIFKLDGFLTQQEGSSIGFVGFAQEGGTNAAYHKNTRSSYKRLYKDGVNYIIFNDAGLNIYGDTELLSVLSTNSTAYTDNPAFFKPRLNDVAVWGNYRSAFYAGSNKYIQVKSPSSGEWNDMGQGLFLPAKIAANEKIELMNSTVVDRAISYDFRTKITNTEGNYFSPAIAVDIYRAIETMKYDATYASYAYYGSTTKTIYYNTAEIIPTGGGVEGEATNFAKNDVITMEPADIADYGFYVLGEYWYRYEYSVIFDAPLVTEKGFCTKWGWPSDDPAYQFEPEFNPIIAIDTQEATYAILTQTLDLTSGTANYGTTPPTFPDASYYILINGSVALPNTDLYFYIKDEADNYFYVGTGNTGTGSTKEFTFSGNFSTLGMTLKAGETYQLHITDTEI